MQNSDLTGSLSNLSAVLFTEYRSKNKPYLLSLSDAMLSQGSAFSTHYYTWINERGCPITWSGKEHEPVRNKKNRFQLAIPIFLGFLGGHLASYQYPRASPLAYIACSFSAKCISDALLHYNGRFKTITRDSMNLTHLFITFIGSFVIGMYTRAHPFWRKWHYIRLLAASYSLNLITGSFLKCFALRIYPKVERAYDKYLLWLNPASFLQESKFQALPKVPQFCNTFSIPQEMLGHILRYLPLEDVRNLGFCNKEFSNAFYLQRICANFSTDFVRLMGSFDEKFFKSNMKDSDIFQLGCKRILEIAQFPPLPLELFSRLEENLKIHEIDEEPLKIIRYEKNLFLLRSCMKNMHIGWGKTSKGDLFLCFKKKFNKGFMIVMSHKDQFDPWNKPICKEFRIDGQIYKIYFDPKGMCDYHSISKTKHLDNAEINNKKFSVFLFG